MYMREGANVYFNVNICGDATDAELEDVSVKIEKYILGKEEYKKVDVIDYIITKGGKLFVSYYPHKEDGTVDKSLLFIAYIFEGDAEIFTFSKDTDDEYSLVKLLDILILKAC